MSNCLQAALDAMSAGISVWPPRQDGSKAPDGGSWKSGQTFRANETQILEWYKPGRTGVGWVTGKVSGDLEILDFDDRSVWAEYQKLCRDAGVGPLLERVMAGYFEHSPNGAHLAYRCSAIEGNQKLAKKPINDKEWKSVIETRGEGGFIVVAPSHGSVNLKGPYVLQSGSVSTIETITPEERRMLFDVAKIFDEAPLPVDTSSSRVSAAGRPGDDFNARSRWEDVLEPHGWVKVGSRLGVISWRRPGKDRGISATTNHAGSDLLYVFSTSTGLESERGYSKFSIYALLNHNGDFAKAAHELSKQGYGIEVPDNSDVDLSFILARASDGNATAPDLTSLMRVPGLVGRIADWINESAIKPQPVLALGASIAAFSTILGQKVRTETDLRTNLYVLGVGETGCGKERARQAIGSLFRELGIDKQLGDSFASDSAVEAAMFQSPVRLYLIDEMGYFMGTMRDELAPAHVKSIVPVLLRMYSSSEGIYRRRTYAGLPQGKGKKKEEDQDSINQPSLSIYGTTVPSNFYANITKSHLSNGLVSRLLVFESTDPDPERRWTDLDARRVPVDIVNECLAWVEAPINANPEGNLDQLHCSPLVVKSTPEARDVFDGLEATMRRKRAEERTAGRDHGPYTRVDATAAKLALIRACGVNPEHPEITVDDAEWGCGMAWGLTDAFIGRVGDAAPENKAEEALQKVLTVIRKRSTISRAGLLRATKMYSDAMDKVVKTLIESGEITMDVEKATNGKLKTTYSSAKQVPKFTEQLHQAQTEN
jgi:hypothetical protein